MKLYSGAFSALQNQAQRTVLFNFHRSSASWRVRILLNLKKIPYEYGAVNLLEKENMSQDFLAINPSGLVPALWIDGNLLTESMAIAEYLEETRPDNFPLLPKDPFKRAVVRRICEHVNAGIQPMQNLRLLDKIAEEYKADKAEWTAYWNKRGHDSLEEIMKQHAGIYSVGDELSLADVFFYPQMYSGVQRFGVRKDDYVHLKRVFDNLLKLEEFRSADPEQQPDAHKKKQPDAPADTGAK